MIARTLCFALSGTEGEPVQVEAYVTTGSTFQFAMVGLPDTAVKESRDRVTAALKNSGFTMPFGHTTINLSPADLKKEGSVFDLPIAMAIILASRQIRPQVDIEKVLLLGELALDGQLTHVNGALSMVIAARERGINQVILPVANAKEVNTVEGMQVFPARSLYEAAQHIAGKMPILPQAQRSYQECLAEQPIGADLAQVRGQASARRALEIAAAGGHNLLMVGVPGSGKTMLARCLPGILPQMVQAEAFETTRIYSVCGMLKPGEGLMTQRPFRTPHHSASVASLVGGGANARPGEVSLAHNGVLFLDEMPEYPRSVLEALRQPLEDGYATVSRVRARAQYQSSFMLVASMNPCPCGYYGSRVKPCRCGSHEIRKYLDRISGPLLDRIELQVEVDNVPIEDITSPHQAEDSLTVRARVVAARNRQLQRYQGTPFRCNAQLNTKHMDAFAKVSPQALKLLQAAMQRHAFSMRVYGRLIKVARTIADLRGDENIELEAMAEAVQFRMIDAKYWGGAYGQ
ncbi:MAG TPA: YifB family Mg chelatase-like AAA ATPase [Clostridiales bacterium]|nr:YifB family Mg chelatase-like AAA ATPase [Clostridiales bacterium]